jgi:hypothetical protein
MSLPIKHAATIGASTGALSGAAIALAMDISLSAALERIGILTFAAAWGGVVLVWLDQGLRKIGAHSRGHSRQ